MELIANRPELEIKAGPAVSRKNVVNVVVLLARLNCSPAQFGIGPSNRPEFECRFFRISLKIIGTTSIQIELRGSTTAN